MKQNVLHIRVGRLRRNFRMPSSKPFNLELIILVGVGEDIDRVWDYFDYISVLNDEFEV